MYPRHPSHVYSEHAGDYKIESEKPLFRLYADRGEVFADLRYGNTGLIKVDDELYKLIKENAKKGWRELAIRYLFDNIGLVAELKTQYEHYNSSWAFKLKRFTDSELRTLSYEELLTLMGALYRMVEESDKLHERDDLDRELDQYYAEIQAEIDDDEKHLESTADLRQLQSEVDREYSNLRMRRNQIPEDIQETYDMLHPAYRHVDLARHNLDMNRIAEEEEEEREEEALRMANDRSTLKGVIERLRRFF